MLSLIEHATHSLSDAARGISRLPDPALALLGLSSPHVRRLLNNLCARPGTSYLEVGTYKGATAVAASYCNPGRYRAVDTFDQFGGGDACRATLEGWGETCRVELLDVDCWTIDPATLFPVNVFFYDGNHSYEDQRRAFVHFAPAFATPFVAIVDDWNWPAVRSGTFDAFDSLGYRTPARWELFTPGNATRDSWWNGVFVAVVERAGGA